MAKMLYLFYFIIQFNLGPMFVNLNKSILNWAYFCSGRRYNARGAWPASLGASHKPRRLSHVSDRRQVRAQVARPCAGHVFSRRGHPHLRGTGCDEPQSVDTAARGLLQADLQLSHLEPLFLQVSFQGFPQNSTFCLFNPLIAKGWSSGSKLWMKQRTL